MVDAEDASKSFGRVIGLIIVLIICAVTLVSSPVFLLFIYPLTGLVLAIAALVALCWQSRPVAMSHVLNFLTCVYLGVATVLVLVIAGVFFPSLAEGFHAWLFFLFLILQLLLAQLFWYRRFRSSPLAAFLIAVASASWYTYLLIYYK